MSKDYRGAARDKTTSAFSKKKHLAYRSPVAISHDQSINQNPFV